MGDPDLLLNLRVTFHVHEPLLRHGRTVSLIGRSLWTAMLTAETQTSAATVICRQSAVICGQAWFDLCFTKLDPAATQVRAFRYIGS